MSHWQPDDLCTVGRRCRACDHLVYAQTHMCWCSIPSDGKQKKTLYETAPHFQINWREKDTWGKTYWAVLTSVNHWLQVLLCHLDCFGDNGSLTLCPFLQLMELDCAWFFCAKRIFSNIFQAFWNAYHYRATIVRHSVSTVRVPDKLHSFGAQQEIPITTNLPLTSCLGVSRDWSLNSAHWITAVTLMVRSPEADTIYLSSKSTTFTAALCPTRTRRRLMSVGEAMSQTAIDLSLEQVTIKPLAKRRWRTASLWWMSVLRTSPVVTSHTLGGSTEKWPLPQMKVWIKQEGRIQRQRQFRGMKRAVWREEDVES